MRKLTVLMIAFGLFATTLFGQDKLITKTGHINFYSHTIAEDISADNYKVISTLDISTGEIVFSVPMQSFEFEIAMMQKHYNSPNFLNTKKFPKAKFKGKITNFSDVDLSKDGSYEVEVFGELTMHGVTKEISEKGTIIVKGSSIIANATLNLTLADYDLSFKNGKPATNVAKVIAITVKLDYASVSQADAGENLNDKGE